MLAKHGMGLDYLDCVQVSALTNATLPLISGFRNNILQNPILVDAIDFASQSPMLQGFFADIGNFTGDLAPIVRAYTVPSSSACSLWHHPFKSCGMELVRPSLDCGLCITLLQKGCYGTGALQLRAAEASCRD